jgi:hypothetical protein
VNSGLPLPTTVNSADASELIQGIYLHQTTDKNGVHNSVFNID